MDVVQQSERLGDTNTSGSAGEVKGTILHVFDHSFPIADGYAYRSGEIIRFERRIGWQTIHVTSSKQGLTQASTETVDGLEFHRTQPAKRSLFSHAIFDQLSVVTTLRRRLEGIIRDSRPVLLHVHSPCLNGLAAITVARRFGLPVIYEMRSLWEDAAVDSGVCREGDLRYRFSRALENHVCRRVDQVVTICEGLRAEMIGRGLRRDRVTIVPNSVDLDRFTCEGSRDEREAARLGLIPGKTFGFIGTFFPFEGLDVLVHAVPAILAREPQARFVLVGDGPEAEKVRGLARHLGVEDAIVFTGRVRHEEVDRYYDLVDVLVYPRVSKRLTELVTPLKPLEAMAKGKLVVASDVGGHREMVFAGRNGILFKAGDPASLADACIDLLRRPQDWVALREYGRRYVREVRSWNQTVQIYDEIYRNLLANCAPA